MSLKIITILKTCTLVISYGLNSLVLSSEVYDTLYYSYFSFKMKTETLSLVFIENELA